MIVYEVIRYDEVIVLCACTLDNTVDIMMQMLMLA